AVELLIEDKSGRAVGIRNNEIMDLDIDEALSHKKVFERDIYKLTKILSI
ncbi:MAG: ATP-dependent 6-phosphofructokinase, partial [Clostridia bacterium]|nr:ATP-dependent 6-phosphofructokinase [Clostridia bacterium]